jgi:serine/threonine protein kinase
MKLDPGAQLGHYQIVGALGRGGMGEVYLAMDTRLERRVALKILPAESSADRDRLARFIREAKAASALNHPNIITVYDIGESAGTYFIAYEFIEGRTLREFANGSPRECGVGSGDRHPDSLGAGRRPRRRHRSPGPQA